MIKQILSLCLIVVFSSGGHIMASSECEKAKKAHKECLENNNKDQNKCNRTNLDIALQCSEMSMEMEIKPKS